ncbi:hypothetical protein PI126_g17935 [Phytophthora idaei]|nr:hypothetical protein PI126_g17935 [Phytophthora idaei]
MAFSLEDEDDRAFKAALSFANECVLDDDEVEDAAALRNAALMQLDDEWAAMSGFTFNNTAIETSFGSVDMTPTVDAIPTKTRSRAASNRKRRMELNERKKLLRKAGIYGDDNWMSKDSRLEIAYLHERIEKLHLDFQKRASHLTNNCSTFMDFAFSNQHIVRVLSSRSGGARDFPLLFRHLETARQEVDAVFASNGLANMVLTPSDVHIREGVDGKYLEAFSNKVLPFGLRAATEATWDHFKGSEKHRGNGNIYEKTAKSLDDPTEDQPNVHVPQPVNFAVKMLHSVVTDTNN